MIRTIPFTGTTARVGTAKHPLRLTALFYLKDALRLEKYESCADIISVAKEFGATAPEIQRLLEDPRRTPG